MWLHSMLPVSPDAHGASVCWRTDERLDGMLPGTGSFGMKARHWMH
jgi:hypothetical protein